MEVKNMLCWGGGYAFVSIENKRLDSFKINRDHVCIFDQGRLHDNHGYRYK